ncbi:MAG TPA: hypothetical protein VJ440_00910, partial [Candidatus Brocadiaceae bacterium]|nr:hypothetical protein [Candidatus Brocadiaceae bacterium]
ILIKLFGLVIVSTPPLFIAIYFIRVDARARAYVDTVKSKLLMLEEEWQQHYPDNCFSTYSQQFAVLVHRETGLVARYLAVRGISDDPFRVLVEAKAAHVGEKVIVQLFVFLWSAMFTFAFVASCWSFVVKVLC